MGLHLYVYGFAIMLLQRIITGPGRGDQVAAETADVHKSPVTRESVLSENTATYLNI